jgi:hypothetical protein
MADTKLDEGFEEVALDEGFEEIDLSNQQPNYVNIFPGEDKFNVIPQAKIPLEGLDSLIQSGAESARGFLTGAVKGASLGFNDELAALIYAGGDIKSPEYKQYRDKLRKEEEEIRKKAPISTTLGEVAGGVATSFVPGLNVAKGAKIAQLLLKGASLGGLTSAGYSEADLTEGDVEGLAGDTARGALLGGTLSATFPALMSKDVIGRATTTSVDPLTGKLVSNLDKSKLLSQLGKSALVTGGSGAALGAAISEDPIEGAKTGALIGAPIGPLARVSTGLGRVFADSKTGQRAKEAFSLGKKGELLLGDEATNKAAKELTDVSNDISKLIEKDVIPSKTKEAFKEIDKVSNRIKNFIGKNKEIKGEKIGNIINDLKETGKTVDIKELTSDLLNKIDDAVNSGQVDENRVKGLREQLLKLREVSQPDIKTSVAKTSKEIITNDGETLLKPTKTVSKVGGKEVSLDELTRLENEAALRLPGKAQVKETVTPSGTTLTNTQENILKQAPKIREDVKIDELLKTKRLISQGLKSTDPNQRALFKQAYGSFIEELTNQIDDPRVQQIYKDLRSDYSNLLKLDEVALTQDIGGKLVPSRNVEKAIEDYSKVGVGRQKESLEELLDLMSKVEKKPETINRLKGQAAVASEALQEAKSLEKLTDPTKIAQQVPNFESPIEYATSPLKEAINKIKDINPKEAIKLEQRAKDVAKKIDLLGETVDTRGMGTFTPKGVLTRLAGAPEQLIVKGSNVAGYLTRVANAAEKQGKTNLSKILRNSLNKDNVGRAATIFTIQNNPGLRKELKELQINQNELDEGFEEEIE